MNKIYSLVAGLLILIAGAFGYQQTFGAGGSYATKIISYPPSSPYIFTTTTNQYLLYEVGNTIDQVDFNIGILASGTEAVSFSVAYSNDNNCASLTDVSAGSVIYYNTQNTAVTTTIPFPFKYVIIGDGSGDWQLNNFSLKDLNAKCVGLVFNSDKGNVSSTEMILEMVAKDND